MINYPLLQYLRLTLPSTARKVRPIKPHNSCLTKTEHVRLSEEWESPQALLDHGATDWFQNYYLVKCKEMIRDPPVRGIYKLDVVVSK